ncbi:hypothetical protein, partial [uncultured Thiobacillus sp.]|uniref:hypothetical protein n=1 Tax=uncultured Thiobacillus sp. TaxID=189996 RepID=UPI002632B1D1
MKQGARQVRLGIQQNPCLAGRHISLMTFAQPSLDPQGQWSDTGYAFQFSEQPAVDTRMGKKLRMFHARKVAVHGHVEMLVHSLNGPEGLGQIVLNVVDLAAPSDIVAKMKRERTIIDSFCAKSAHGVQRDEEQIIEIGRANAAIAEVKLRHIRSWKDETIVTIGNLAWLIPLHTTSMPHRNMLTSLV